jgi:RNA polymerase sigma-70 factor (ECF subfamily)
LNDHRRLAARRERPVSDLSPEQAALLTEIADHSICQNPEQAALACDLVERLMATLTPPERLVVELLYLEGCGAHEVAELNGWSTVRVRVTAFRARRKMRVALERMGTH